MTFLNNFLNLPNGAIWLKADLHIHTPGSDDCKEDISPEDIVRVAIEKGLSLIAITDHNTASWCDRVQIAAKNTSLTVFPGVEISTHQGHVLAIFDTNTPSTIIEDLLLVDCKIPRTQIGSLDVATRFGISEVCDFIEDAGAVAIAAHVEGERGFLNTIQVAAEKKRAYASKNLRGLEIVDPASREIYQKGITTEYSRKLACIQSSDSTGPGSRKHLLANIASRYCFIKMGDRNISGLKLALIDPEMRIRLATDVEPTPTRTIMAMWVTGGFLDGQNFRFSDNVNCFIGDTGAGKSVALELMRFCLDYPPIVTKINAEVDRLLSQQLGNLSTVHIILRKDASYYLVERTFGTPRTPPSVSRLTTTATESINEQIDMHLFFPIKAFSQSEIIEYAREPQVRLSLTDDLIDCNAENTKIAELKVSLKENAAKYIAEKSMELNIKTQLAELPTLYESLKQLDAVLNDPRIKTHQQWYKEKTLLENATRQLNNLDTSIETSKTSLQLVAPIKATELEIYPNPDLLNELLMVFTTWQQLAVTSCDSLKAGATTALGKSISIKSEWNIRFDKAEAEYKALLLEIDKDGKGLQAISERRQQIDSQISALDLLKNQLETNVLPGLSTLDTTRENLLSNLQNQRIAITNKRETKARELTTKLNNTIRLHVRQRSSKTQFRIAVEQLGKGSGIKTVEYDLIAEKLHPIPFVKQLVSRVYDRLVSDTGIDTSRFEKLMDFIVERDLMDNLYELQLTDIDDVIDVMLKVEEGTYKHIEDLAHGQKCMVVLMIALAEGDFPLIVDQPEDALHAPGIEQGIVSTLRFRRGIRQCIFATRNANIIVSADAEQILSLKADAKHGEIVSCGCLDSFSQKNLVLYHVEGGEEAFNLRQTMYYLRPTS
jgi:PHP family Zn ribbon phosphoesterase